MKNKIIFWAVISGLCLISCGGCESTSSRPFTIGILNSVSIHDPCLDGFKTGMNEFGYIEGKNIRYIYNGLVEARDDSIDAEIKRLRSQGIDLLLTTGNEVSIRARMVLMGTDLPVVIGIGHMLIEQGIVENLTHPGGNITGVQAANSLAKAIEWLKILIPGLKKVYLPYNPDDIISVMDLKWLIKNSPKQKIELVIQQVHSVEETVAAIQTLPEEVDAILRIPSPTLDPRNSELSQAAISRSLPMAAVLHLDEGVLISFGSDFFESGRQAARLAQQIHQGVKPADIPIETSDVFLTINLRTAEKIGITIPDDVLAQAKTIIR